MRALNEYRDHCNNCECDCRSAHAKYADTKGFSVFQSRGGIAWPHDHYELLRYCPIFLPNCMDCKTWPIICGGAGITMRFPSFAASTRRSSNRPSIARFDSWQLSAKIGSKNSRPDRKS